MINQRAIKVANKDVVEGFAAPENTRELNLLPQTKRIALAMTGRLFRDCVRQILQRPDRIVVATHETLDEVMQDLLDLPPPDLLVAAIEATERTPEAFGKIRRMRAGMPNTKWVILGRQVDERFLREAIFAGVEGVLLDEAPSEVLQHIVELVLLGQIVFPMAALKNSLFNGISADGPALVDIAQATRTSSAGHAPVVTYDLAAQSNGVPAQFQTSLSEREKEILRGLARGHSNKTIARYMKIAEATVKIHVQTLFRKLQVKNRTQAALSASAKLIPLEPIDTPTKVGS